MTINFNNSLKILINIDCFIIPVVFSFEVYNYNLKLFCSEIDIYLKKISQYTANNEIINNIYPNIYPLHFRVILPNYNYKGNIEFSCFKSKSISIINNNIPKELKDNKFTFDLDLNINNNLLEEEKNSFNILLKILNIEKCIKLNIKIIEQFINHEKFLNYEYLTLEKYSNKQYIKVNQKIEKPLYNNIYVSYFGHEPAFILKYFDNLNSINNFRVNSSNNYFLKINFGKFKFFNKSVEVVKSNLYNYEILKSPCIIGYINDNSNKEFWYPTFFRYDNYFENIEEHQDNFRNVLEDIKNKYQKINQKEMKGNFATFALGIANLNSDNIENIINFLREFLIKIKNILNLPKKILNIYNELENRENKDLNVNRYLFDIIFEFYSMFKKRYEEIRENNFTIIPNFIKKDDIIKRSNHLLNNNYFKYNKSKIYISNYEEPFKDINQMLLNIKNNSLNSSKQKSKAIIIKEGNISLMSEDIKQDFSLSKELIKKEVYVGNTKIFKTCEIQDISYPKEWTISSLQNFYNEIIKITRELPLYAISAKIEKNEVKLRKTEKIYLKLLNIYEKTPENDDSFISDLVLDFTEQFKKITINLINSNIRFGEILPKKLKLTNFKKDSDLYNEQYIIYPKKKKIFELNEKQWEINDKNNKKYNNQNENMDDYLKEYYFTSNNFISNANDSLYEIEQVKEKDIEMPQNLKEEKSNENENKEIPNFINKEKLEDFIIKQKLNENTKKNFENINENQNIQDNHELEVNKDLSNKKENRILNIDNFNLNEDIIIQLVIDRMKEIEEKIKNKKYPLPDLGIKKDLKGQSDLNNEDSATNIFNIIKLYEEGRFLAKKIVIELSKRKIPFNKISVNLLLDCSGFISIENKLKQYTIICRIVNSFNILNIQYAISIVGDSQFGCTLKPFDVGHSMKSLQKILDCLFIKRFTGKNANFINYAIKFTKAKTSNRVFLVFTNGLDEDFLLIESWKNKIITNSNFSFGFFFINSENLINNHFEELNYLKIKWNEFRKSFKNVELLYYNSTFDNYNALYNNIAFIIGNLLERQIVEQEKEFNIEFNLPEFDLTKYIRENNISLNSISKYKKVFEANFENLTEIYFKKIKNLKVISNKVYKLNNNYYKNKLSKIGNYELKDEKLKNDIHLYAKKFIDNKTKLNKAKIELIFKPNKASQKVLSTSGTEFDIQALIMNLIKPSPDPMIYLEEKGGMIRKYSVSLIIDTSYSCFNPLSFSFSLQTIRVILSSLNFIDLPSFDLILSTHKNPLVLCSDVNTIRAINSKSLIWESLLPLLDNPCQKSDLASSIEVAFDLRRKNYLNIAAIYLF